MSGVTSKGSVWVSFENATVAGYSASLSASHDPSMTLDPSTMMPALADATLSGGVDYWFLVYPNVDPSSTTTIGLVSPAGHACTPREAITDWKLFAGATTYVDADCN